MHIMGIGYGFLWREKGNLIEELWHINDFHEMVDHAMRYYGRDYLWLTKGNGLAAYPSLASSPDMKITETR